MTKLESEFKELEAHLATPESYGSREELINKTKRHEDLITLIKQAAEKWEQVSREIELKSLNFEKAQQEMAAEYGRMESNSDNN